MSRLDSFSGKMMDLAGQVGDSVRNTLPSGTGKWLQTGAAIGVAKSGSRAVGSFVRRNPAVVVAVAIGAGAAWYALHRYRRKQQASGGGEVFEGQSRRIEPRRTAPKSKSSTGSASGDEARPAPPRKSSRAKGDDGPAASDA